MATVQRYKVGHLVKWIVSKAGVDIKQFDNHYDALIYSDKVNHNAR